MASFGGEYDATSGETMGESSPLPAGEYVAAIVKSEYREAKSGNGNAYINLEFEVLDGQYQGRRFWTMLNLWNHNQTAVEIAQRELNSICHAVGKLRVSDSEQLHNIPMLVRLAVKTDSYGEKNETKGYKPLNQGSGAAPANQQQAPQQQAGSTAPWRRTA